MATSTLTPQDQDEDRYNPGEKNYQNTVGRFSSKADSHEFGLPEEAAATAADLAAREDSATAESSADGVDDTSDLSNSEEKGDANWNTNVSMQAGGSSSFLSSNKNKAAAGAAALASSSFIIGITIAVFTAAIGIVNLHKTMLNGMGEASQNVLERRAAVILAKKFTKNMTKGCTVNINCRYRGFTKSEIKKFNKRALQYGYKIESTGRSGLNLTRQSVNIVEMNRDGSTKRTISAANLSEAFKNNPALFNATKNFYKGKVQYYGGKAGRGALARMGVNIGKHKTSATQGDDENKKREQRTREMVRSQAAGDVPEIRSSTARDGTSGDPASDSNTDGSVTENDKTVKEVVGDRSTQLEADRDDYTKSLAEPEMGTKEYVSTYSTSTEKIRKLGSGVVNAVVGNPLTAVQGFCVVKILVGLVSQSRALGQMLQLAKYAGLYGSVAGLIQLGNGDADVGQQASDLMSAFQSTDANGKTGSDSMGFNFAATGAVRTGVDEDVGKYQNGGPAPGLFGSTVQDSVNEIPDTICSIALSATVTYISIGLMLIPGAGQLLAKGASLGIKAAVEKGITTSLKSKLKSTLTKDFAKKLVQKGGAGRTVAGAGSMYAFFDLGIPPLIAAISRAATKTVITGDEKGRAVGNALSSGYGALASSVGKSQGLQPLSVASAVGMNQENSEYQKYVAKMENTNQFDTNNEHSFVSKLATTMAPITGSLSSPSSFVSGITSLSSKMASSFSLKVAAKEDPQARYKFCQDYKLKEANVAGDPFCNPQYGFEKGIINNPQYDPDTVSAYLYSNGFVTTDGSPQGDFQDFIDKCINTNSPIGDDPRCVEKANKNYTMMRLYCVDTSIDNDMNDGDGIGCAPEVAASVAPTDSGGTIASPDAVDLATLYEPSQNIACAAGSKDLGVQSGYHGGKEVKVRVCAVNDIPETGELSTVSGAGGKLVVNARMSAIYVKLAQDAKTAGINVSAAEGFRTMERQQYFWDLYKSGRGNLAAQPGFSNHQSGVAVDWSPPVYNWLSGGKAATYGLKQCTCGEQWHYSPDGG